MYELIYDTMLHQYYSFHVLVAPIMETRSISAIAPNLLPAPPAALMAYLSLPVLGSKSGNLLPKTRRAAGGVRYDQGFRALHPAGVHP